MSLFTVDRIHFYGFCVLVQQLYCIKTNLNKENIKLGINIVDLRKCSATNS